MSINTTISVQDGQAAASNLANNSVVYVTPGNSITVALQSSAGVAQWSLVGLSDYGPLNGPMYQTSGPAFSYTFPMPQTPCKLVLTSEATDGNNNYFSANTLFNYPKQAATVHQVRYVCTANVNIANCNVVQDGVTGIAGDRVLLVNQTNAAQNGPYVVGTVAANLTALTRPGDYATGQVSQAAPVFEVSEGTSWAMSTWKVNSTGAVTVDTSNVTMYPRSLKGSIANVAANGNVTSQWVMSNSSVAVAVCTNAANAVRVSAVVAGAGSGYVTVAGTSGDNAAWLLTNW